jgi:hypothetical protein
MPVCEDDPLRRARTARGVLKQRDGVRRGQVCRWTASTLLREVRDAENLVQSTHLRSQPTGDRLRRGESDEYLGTGIGKDPGMPLDVLLKLRTVRRRVEGNGNAAGEQHAEEGVQILDRRRQHERDSGAPREAARLESRSDRLRALEQLAVCEHHGLRLAEYYRVGRVWLPLRAPHHDFGQTSSFDRLSCRCGRLGVGRCDGEWREAGTPFLRSRGRAAHHGREVADGIDGLERARRELYTQGTLEALEELDAREAVEPQVGIEATQRIEHVRRCDAVQFLEEGPHGILDDQWY